MLAKALAHNKAKRVYIIGRRKEKLDDAVEEIERPGVVVPLVGDITDQDCLKRLADVVKEREGYIDLLIPNAGTSTSVVKCLISLAVFGILEHGGFDKANWWCDSKVSWVPQSKPSTSTAPSKTSSI